MQEWGNQMRSNIRKPIIIFGVVTLALLMFSSATAVSVVNSQPVVNHFDKQVTKNDEDFDAFNS